ncbi:hypothetical protein OESDEN_18762 [Oesophagostomum dentatum]|uniref:Uncharacterized protein n=1 Tax=Oesophagostomum dentatum TaxID=61180 RepID=A0A0B1SCD8_OESDE|nr:hypothetical protein OESDEN_18762 [Oesophagostomum dentatum]
MWMLFLYALIPDIIYGPSFGYTSLNFVYEHLYDWLKKHGFLGGAGDSTLILDIASAALKAMPWFVLFFPLVQAILAVICIRPFREQLFFLLSCGRIYGDPAPAVCKSEKEWALEGSKETLEEKIEIVKMESEPVRRSLR